MLNQFKTVSHQHSCEKVWQKNITPPNISFVWILFGLIHRAIPTLEGQLPLILVRFQRNSGESSGSSKNDPEGQRTRSGPELRRNGRFYVRPKSGFWPKNGSYPKKSPKMTFSPLMFHLLQSWINTTNISIFQTLQMEPWVETTIYNFLEVTISLSFR